MMKLSDELKQWGYHAGLSEGGSKQHLEMADKADQLERKVELQKRVIKRGLDYRAALEAEIERKRVTYEGNVKVELPPACC